MTIERVRMWKLTVTGTGAFPLDMLRHDRCWPRDTIDAHRIAPEAFTDEEQRDVLRKPRTVVLLTNSLPHAARWASFGWHCKEEEVH